MERDTRLLDVFFKGLEEGEKIRISAGEGYGPAIKSFGERLEKVSDKADITIIIGPIISVSGEYATRDEGNLYTKLAKSGNATLYCPPNRQRFHYKVRSDSYVIKEDYHMAQAPKEARHQRLINNREVVDTFIRDFDLLIAELNLEAISKENWGNHFVYLTERENELLAEDVKKDTSSSIEMSIVYDFMTYAEITERLKKLGIYSDEMIAT